MNANWIEVATALGLGVALAAAAGMRVFVPLFVLGASARLGWVPLAIDFEWLATNVGLATLAVAVVLEVGAYYLPWVDNLLDMATGPLALISGFTAFAAVTTELPPEFRWGLAVVAGGGTAGVVQGLTSLTRLKSTAMTAGLANPLVATLELFGSLTTSVLAVVAPVIALVLIVVIVLGIRRAAGAARTGSRARGKTLRSE